MSKIYDLVGVGFGPANIALAIAVEELYPDKSSLFLEASPDINWQRGMLFENALDIHSNIQNIPHRDLVTPRNPRSRYTFLNYLHENNRLLYHLNLDLLLPMRSEYSDYIAWVGQQFANSLRLNYRVADINKTKNHFVINNGIDEPIKAKNLVIATGRAPNIPEVFQAHIQRDTVFHLNDYLPSITKLVANGAKKIAVIGSSQTAVEIILHLTKSFDVEVDAIFRRFAFPLKDTNPFMSEIFFPEFTDLYYQADNKLKNLISKDVFRTNYGAADMDVLEELYRQIYYDKLANKNKISLYKLSSINSVNADDHKVQIEFEDQLAKTKQQHEYDGVVLATGFKNIGPEAHDLRYPKLLTSLVKHFELDAAGAVQVDKDYAVTFKQPESNALILNGLCETSHGMGDAGSLSLVSLRAERILHRCFAEATNE